jgi:hypothetical protein
MNGVRSRTVRVNSRSSSVVYGATHIRTKCEKAGNPLLRAKYSIWGKSEGIQGKGMIPKKTESGRLPPCCNMGEPVRS